jgi:GntR family transcriptional regulator
MSSRPTLSAGPAFFNPFPKYLQVRQVLERRLFSGFEQGQQLPTEKALCEEFGVSRETVREALRGLEEAGVIQRKRAKGTFFIGLPAQVVEHRLTGLVEDYASLKLDTYAVVLEASLMSHAPAASGLQTGAAEPLFMIRRLRYLDDRPLVLHEAYLPPAIGQRIAALDLSHASISHLLEKRLRMPCVEERHQIDAVVADTELARLLDIPVGAPVLQTSRVIRPSKGAGSILFKSWYRADRYYYTLNLVPPSGAGKPATKRPKKKA